MYITQCVNFPYGIPVHSLGYIMSDISALSSGLLGIQKGLAGLNKNAAKIASAGQMNSQNLSELVEPLVNLKINQLQIEASAKVVQTSNDTIGSLLDIMV